MKIFCTALLLSGAALLVPAVLFEGSGLHGPLSDFAAPTYAGVETHANLISGLLDNRIPVTVLSGGRDRTAPGRWHLPWLRARTVRLRLMTSPAAGPLVHHVDPDRTDARVGLNVGCLAC